MMDFDPFEEDDASIDLTPLIDVVFMLLIFFIMATSFSKPVIDIILPDATSSSVPEKKQKNLLISVDGTGTYYYEQKTITIEELKELIANSEGSYLNFYVDKKTPFQAFLRLIDLAKMYKNGEFLITTNGEAP